MKKGDLLFVVDPRPATAALAQARAELERLHVDRALATRDTTRSVRLLREAAIPEQQWDTQNSQLQQLVAREGAATAAVELAPLELEYCFVRAPVAGRIGRIIVTVGNLVGPTLPSPLATLVSVDPLYVYVDVDESHALRLGRSVVEGKRTATVGFGEEGGHPHAAAIDFLDNRIDPQTGTQKVRVVVKNEGGALVPGLFARVNIPESDERPVVLVADRRSAPTRTGASCSSSMPRTRSSTDRSSSVKHMMDCGLFAKESPGVTASSWPGCSGSVPARWSWPRAAP